MSESTSWISFQDKARIITSYVIVKSLQVYRDDASMGSEMYKLRHINKEIKRHKDVYFHMTSRLNANSMPTKIENKSEDGTSAKLSGKDFDEPKLFVGHTSPLIGETVKILESCPVNGYPPLRKNHNELCVNVEQDATGEERALGVVDTQTFLTEPCGEKPEWPSVDVCKEDISNLKLLLPYKEQVQVVNRPVSGVKEEATAPSLRGQIDRDAEIRQERGLNVSSRYVTGFVDADYLKSRQPSNVNDQEKIFEASETQMNREENLLDRAFTSPRYFRRQHSDTELCKNSSAFEPEKCQHFKSVIPPRKRLRRFQSCPKHFAKTTCEKSLDICVTSSGVDVNITCSKSDNCSKGMSANLPTCGEKLVHDSDEVVSFSLDVDKPRNPPLLLENKTAHFIDGDSERGGNPLLPANSLFTPVRCFTKKCNKFEGLAIDDKISYPPLKESRCIAETCLFLHEEDRKLTETEEPPHREDKSLTDTRNLLHTENIHLIESGRSPFVRHDIHHKEKLQKDSTSNFYRKQSWSTLNSFSEGAKESVSRISNSIDMCDVQANRSLQRNIRKSNPDEDSLKANTNIFKDPLIAKQNINTCNSFFYDSVLKIWGIDKAIKCWKNRTQTTRLAVAQPFSDIDGKKECLLNSQAEKSHHEQHGKYDTIFCCESGVMADIFPTEMKSSNVRSITRGIDTQAASQVGASKVISDSFQANMLAFVKKWKQISKTGYNRHPTTKIGLANDTLAVCLKPGCSQLGTAKIVSDRSRGMLITKTLILAAYLKEAQTQINNLGFAGTATQEGNISEVDQDMIGLVLKDKLKETGQRVSVTLGVAASDSVSNLTKPKAKSFKSSCSDSQILCRPSPDRDFNSYSDGSSLCLDNQINFKVIHNTQSDCLYNNSTALDLAKCREEYEDNQTCDKAKDELLSEEEQIESKHQDSPKDPTARRLSKYLSGVSPTSDEVFFASKSSMALQCVIRQRNSEVSIQEPEDSFTFQATKEVSQNYNEHGYRRKRSHEGNFSEILSPLVFSYRLKPAATCLMNETDVRNEAGDINSPSASDLVSRYMDKTDKAICLQEIKNDPEVDIQFAQQQESLAHDDPQQLSSLKRASPEGQSGDSAESLDSDTSETESSQTQSQTEIKAFSSFMPAPLLEADQIGIRKHKPLSSEAEVSMYHDKDLVNTIEVYASSQSQWPRRNSNRLSPYTRPKWAALSRLKMRLRGFHKTPETTTPASDEFTVQAKFTTDRDRSDQTIEESSSQRQKPTFSARLGYVFKGTGKLKPLNLEKPFESSLASLWMPGVLACVQAAIGGNSQVFSTMLSSSSENVTRKDSIKWVRLSVFSICISFYIFSGQ